MWVAQVLRRCAGRSGASPSSGSFSTTRVSIRPIGPKTSFSYHVIPSTNAKRSLDNSCAVSCARLQQALDLWDGYHHSFYMVELTTQWLLFSFGAQAYFVCYFCKRLLDEGLIAEVFSSIHRSGIDVLSILCHSVIFLLRVLVLEIGVVVLGLHLAHLGMAKLLYWGGLRQEIAQALYAHTAGDSCRHAHGADTGTENTGRGIKSAKDTAVIICARECDEEKESSPPTSERDVIGVLRGKEDHHQGTGLRTWSLWDCVVAPEFRKQKIAFGLMEAMEMHARKTGVKRLSCIVLSPPAKQLCRSLGYRITNYPWCLCQLWPTTYAKIIA